MTSPTIPTAASKPPINAAILPVSPPPLPPRPKWGEIQCLCMYACCPKPVYYVFVLLVYVHVCACEIALPVTPNCPDPSTAGNDSWFEDEMSDSSPSTASNWRLLAPSHLCLDVHQTREAVKAPNVWHSNACPPAASLLTRLLPLAYPSWVSTILVFALLLFSFALSFIPSSSFTPSFSYLPLLICLYLFVFSMCHCFLFFHSFSPPVCFFLSLTYS